jgi:hypothetical protein
MREHSYEIVEVLEWNALQSIFGAGQGTSAAPISAAISAKRATPASVKSDTTLRARARRGVWPRHSFVAARCGDGPYSLLAIRPFWLYARTIPVFQRSHKRSSICAIGFATSANPITTSAIPHQRNGEISSPRKIQQPSGTRISTTRDKGKAMVIGIYLNT